MSFPRYPSYKDSGVEWLGEVPEHWDVIRLKNVLQRRITDGPHTTPVFVDDGVPFLSVDGIQDGELKFDGCRFISEADHEEYRRKALPQKNDLLMGKAASTGKIARVKVDFEFSIWSPLALIRLDPKVSNPTFYEQSLKSPIVQAQIDNLCTANTQKNISMDDIPKLILTRPPLPEQTQIAAFLDRETAKIDELVAEQQRLMELLKEKRQAVISHAVTQGLNPDAPMKPSGIEWLGDVPAHWEVKRLKHISPFITVGIVVNPSTFVADEGFPFIYGGDIREGVIDWASSRRIDAESSEANSKTRLKAGDLLTVRVGAPGITAVVPPECEGGNCASVMLVRQGSFNSHWLCYAMNTRIVRFQVEVVQYGAAQEQFNISHAVNFWTPTPPRAEQDEIAEFLTCETAKFDTLTAAAQRAINLLQERRTALISAAVTGKVDVRKFA